MVAELSPSGAKFNCIETGNNGLRIVPECDLKFGLIIVSAGLLYCGGWLFVSLRWPDGLIKGSYLVTTAAMLFGPLIVLVGLYLTIIGDFVEVNSERNSKWITLLGRTVYEADTMLHKDIDYIAFEEGELGVRIVLVGNKEKDKFRFFIPTIEDGLWYLDRASPRLSLPEIYLDQTSVNDADLKHLKSLGSLRVIDLTGTHVTIQGLGYLESLNQLNSIRLNKSKFTVKQLIKHLKGLTTLLGLANNTTQPGIRFDDSKRVMPTIATAFEFLEDLHRLHSLNFTDAHVAHRNVFEKNQILDNGVCVQIEGEHHELVFRGNRIGFSKPPAEKQAAIVAGSGAKKLTESNNEFINVESK